MRTLTPYALAHLRLLDIQRRWERVMQRRAPNSIWDDISFYFHTDTARTTGQKALDKVWDDQQRAITYLTEK